MPGLLVVGDLSVTGAVADPVEAVLDRHRVEVESRTSTLNSCSVLTSDAMHGGWNSLAPDTGWRLPVMHGGLRGLGVNFFVGSSLAVADSSRAVPADDGVADGLD